MDSSEATDYCGASFMVNGSTARPVPDLMTEAELIEYLRIPEISKAKDPHHVVENLKRMRGLPRLRICNKTLYPLKAVREWIDSKTERGK